LVGWAAAATTRHITARQFIPAAAGRVDVRPGSFRFVLNVDEADVLLFG